MIPLQFSPKNSCDVEPFLTALYKGGLEIPLITFNHILKVEKTRQFSQLVFRKNQNIQG